MNLKAFKGKLWELCSSTVPDPAVRWGAFSKGNVINYFQCKGKVGKHRKDSKGRWKKLNASHWLPKHSLKTHPKYLYFKRHIPMSEVSKGEILICGNQSLSDLLFLHRSTDQGLEFANSTLLDPDQLVRLASEDGPFYAWVTCKNTSAGKQLHAYSQPNANVGWLWLLASSSE